MDLSGIFSHPVLALATVLVVAVIAFAKAYHKEKRHHGKTSAHVKTYRNVADAEIERRREEAAKLAAADVDSRCPDLTA